MIPKIFHQTARSKKLTWEEERLARRLRRMHVGWTYRLWDDADNARLIRDLFPQYADRYDAVRFGVAKADIARYAYMHAHGGFYIDTDYKLFRPINDGLLANACIIPLEGADPHDGRATPEYLGLGNAILGSRAGHPFWGRLIEHIFEDKKPETLSDREHIIRTTGPEVLTRFYLARAEEFPDIALPPKNCFYPALSRMATKTSADPETYGVHLHWGSWRNMPLAVAARNLFRRKLNALLS